MFSILYLSWAHNSPVCWCGYSKVWFPHGCSQFLRSDVHDCECLLIDHVCSYQNYKPQVANSRFKFWKRYLDTNCKVKLTNPFVDLDVIKHRFVSLNPTELLRQLFMETQKESSIRTLQHVTQLYSSTSPSPSASLTVVMLYKRRDTIANLNVAKRK